MLQDLLQPSTVHHGIGEFRSDLCYQIIMHDGPNPGEFSLTKLRAPRLVAMRLHEVEGNPLSPDQIAMFEMFERENWSADRRRAYILAEAMPLAAE